MYGLPLFTSLQGVSRVFAYMAVQGFIHTRNRVKYNGRLFFWALVVFLGNLLLNYCFALAGIRLYHNIFFTLALGVLMLNLLTLKLAKCWSAVLFKFLTTVIILGVGLFFAEGGNAILPIMLITFLCADRTKLRNWLYAALSVLLLVMSYSEYETVEMTIKMLLFNGDWLFITFLPAVYLYNGERGPNTKFSKYFFYVFYPAHLWILAAIGYIVSSH